MDNSLFTSYVLEGDVMPGLLTAVPKKGCDAEWAKFCVNLQQTFWPEFSSVADIEQTRAEKFEGIKGHTSLAIKVLS